MKKILTSIFLMTALMAMTVGRGFAQEPIEQITGTVQSVEFETDVESGETTVLVTLLDDMGEIQSLRLSPETAESLGLISTDLVTGQPSVADGAVDSEVTIDPAVVIPDETEVEEEVEEEEPTHPVGLAVSEFFGSLVGVDYDTIMASHEDGFGFGVILQALWLANQIEGDAATFEALLEAKQSGDYSASVLADGSTPDNWGDVVKSLKKGSNLGSVMSGKADSGEESGDEEIQATERSNGNDNNGNGNSNKDKDKDNNGKSKNK
ncbi:MAG: hypothetical protein FJ031_14300 [Chloroflexi bacterium]|nr:hypothetical protein [Chloroflexota bacterium]